MALDAIQFKRMIVAGIPDASQLLEGEFILNLADRNIFTKDHTGKVISIGGAGAAIKSVNGMNDEHVVLDKTHIGLSAVNNWSATSAVNDASTTKYATSAAAKTAYDKAVEALNTANGKLGRTEKAADSDKLDGLNSSDFSRSNHTHTGLSTVTVTNWNATNIGNMFCQADGAANAPEGGWIWLMNMQHGSGYGMQIAAGNGTRNYFMRSRNASGAGTWDQLWHTGNLNPGAIGAAAASHSHSGATWSTLYLTDWVRPKGQSGIYFQDYGGGFHMTDTTWIRAYGGKRFYVSSTANDALHTSGGLVCSGNVTAYSDIRVKKNIKIIENALDKVCQLRGITYDRTDMDNIRQTGLVAQELEKVLPEAVTTSKNDHNGIEDFRTVAYGNVVGLLVEAIKELKQEVEQLKSKVA